MAKRFEGQPPPFDAARLAALIASRRQLNGLSIRQAGMQAGLAFSTVSRVENGELPDLTSFLRLAAWVEVPPAEFFASGPARTESTLAQIAYLLHADSSLPAGAAHTITGVVRHILTALGADTELEESRG